MPLITFEELISVLQLEEELEHEQQNLLELESIATSTTQKLTGMPLAHLQNSKTEKNVLLLTECKQRIMILAANVKSKKFELWQKIKAQHLERKKERLLCLRYVYCQSFDEIAHKMSFSKKYVGKIHKWALQSLGID